jgi:hypothetical protein
VPEKERHLSEGRPFLQNMQKPDERDSQVRNFFSGIAAIIVCMAFARQGNAQTPSPAASPQPQAQNQTEESGTSTDLFVMLGSDLDRPGWVPAANYNIGIGRTFGFLKKDPLGDELTVAYTYESGGPAYWHSTINSDTESIGVMKNFGLPKTKRVSAYTWVQIGLTSYTGGTHVENRFYDGESIGTIVHLSHHSSLWIQETFNKIVTVPWYLTSSIGYTWSW